MIKSGLKNYFINLKHFFTPIGTLAVGIFIGASILIPGALAIISALADSLINIVKDASIDFNSVKEYIVGAVKALDWNDPIGSLKTMLSREWLNLVVNDCLNIVAGGLEPYAEAIESAVGNAIAGIIALFVVFIVLCILGLIGGYFLTRFLVRRTMAKRTFKKFMFALFVDSFVTAALFSVSVYLMTVWEPSILITSVLSLIIFGCISLLSAYFVHGRKVIDFKKVINFGNICKLLLVNLLIFVISLVLLGLTVAITNPIAGVLIGFSFVEIAFIVISLNAEGYVLNLATSVPQEQERLPEAA